jgi:aminoglycoside phosphotransferase (APT) family kinase protein
VTGSDAAADERVDPAVVSAVAELGLGEVVATTRLTGGASRSTWRCEVDGTWGRSAVVVQRQRVNAERDMAIEAAVLDAASAAGVPVPEVLGFLPDVDGAATLVTRHVPGETIARRILRNDRYATARGRLVEQLGRSLARLHRIGPDAIDGIEADDLLTSYRERLDESGQPHPAFELAFRWLDEHRPPPSTHRLVHGDYRLGNVIVDEEGLAAVIDWELSHLGDPMEDLGWLCVPAWRFGSSLPAAGVGTRRELLAAYDDEAGTTTDVEVLRWWELAGILKWGIICVDQAETHRSGTVRSHELAAIGRRVCETEHDLFLALEGRW